MKQKAKRKKQKQPWDTWIADVTLMLKMSGWPAGEISDLELKSAFKDGATPEAAVSFWTSGGLA